MLWNRPFKNNRDADRAATSGSGQAWTSHYFIGPHPGRFKRAGSREALNQGVAAFKDTHYPEAVEFFQHAVTLDPNNVTAHLYLGTAYMSMWIPGAKTPENDALARSAQAEFQRVLGLDANNTVALASMASVAYNSHDLDDAMDWYNRLAAIDPTSKEAFYSMGVIAWAKWYPALTTARAKLKMMPQDPGPLPAPFREELKAQYASLIEEGIANLDRALALDPKYDDAMAYINLLIRERADLLDTKEEYKADVATADAWVQKNLDTKKSKAQAGIEMPSQARGGGGGESRASIPRVQHVPLVSKVDPFILHSPSRRTSRERCASRSRSAKRERSRMFNSSAGIHCW
jgi:tetratricopeptide (TPR) repeat protein